MLFIPAFIPSPSQSVWQLGPVPLRAYAFFILLGIFVAVWLGNKRWIARGGLDGQVADIAMWAVPFGIIGGRIYHVATDWELYFSEGGKGFLGAFRIWEGGLGIWGALALGGVGAWIGAKRLGVPFAPFADSIAPGIAYEMTVANLAAGGGVPGFLAGAEAGASMLGTAVVEGVSSAVAATGFVEAGSLLMAGELSAALAAIGPAGWVVLGVVAVASFLGYGGGGSSPPPKESKFHAAIYVSGNNDISAIAPVYQTTDYHAPPDAYKTIAYGLLRVAFNAAKAAEQVTKMTPPFDYLYIKVEFNRISLCWGKGAPDANTLATSDANQAGSWGAPTPETNLNSIAKDIVDLITAEFKKIAGADAKKLEIAKTTGVYDFVMGADVTEEKVTEVSKYYTEYITITFDAATSVRRIPVVVASVVIIAPLN